MQPIVRTPVIDDASGIAYVHVKTWQEAYQGIVPDGYLNQLSVQVKTENWKSHIKNNPSSILVLEADVGIVGFCCFGPCRDPEFNKAHTWEIYSIYVLPEEWHKGYGSVLWQEVVRRAQKNAILNLYLWVFEANKDARRFYESRGMINRATDQPKCFVKEGISVPEIRYSMVLP